MRRHPRWPPFAAAQMGERVIALNADTKRSAVAAALRSVGRTRSPAWRVIANRRWQVSKVVPNPTGEPLRGWCAYLTQPLCAPEILRPAPRSLSRSSRIPAGSIFRLRTTCHRTSTRTAASFCGLRAARRTGTLDRLWTPVDCAIRTAVREPHRSAGVLKTPRNSPVRSRSTPSPSRVPIHAADARAVSPPAVLTEQTREASNPPLDAGLAEFASLRIRPHRRPSPRRSARSPETPISRGTADRVAFALCAQRSHVVVWRRFNELRHVFPDTNRPRTLALPADDIAHYRVTSPTGHCADTQPRSCISGRNPGFRNPRQTTPGYRRRAR